MRISKAIVLGLFVVVLVALAVASQISQVEISNPNAYVDSIATSVNSKLSVEEKSDCIRSYYNKTEAIYGYAPRTRDTYGTCYNPSNQSNYVCVNGTETYQNYEAIGTRIVLTNTSSCTPHSFVVSISKNGGIEKKEIDFSSWGVCLQETENNCVAIICGTLEGGSAWNGVFNGCDGGKSCEKFLFCEDGVKVLYKAARKDFVEHDPTFKLSKLAYKEVGK